MARVSEVAGALPPCFPLVVGPAFATCSGARDARHRQKSPPATAENSRLLPRREGGRCECRKPIVNKNKIERLKGRDPEPIHLSALPEDRGDPLSAVETVRPKRSKTIPKEQVCLFSNWTSVPRMTQSHCTVFLLTQWVKHSYRSSRKPPMTMLEFQ
ncbi:hypothetical protein GWK47_001880 [Chionoecetes opilio]|uniref:Uncharacterized protein n=1 Tax=Chionoecetes opilio TaxID=41210 RepID=A0A8J5CK79_CHIOP|nr:hypothetical protein GWK47_001880 [Chionoecetes opilio]